jgi:hypothetical protein
VTLRSREERRVGRGHRGVLTPRTAPVLDLVAVLVFVAIGRAAHAHGLSLGGLASTAWPFVAGLAVGWGAVSLRHTPPLSLRGGLVLSLATVAVGMLLRVAAGQGTAVAFIVVALIFLGATMCGWRLLRMVYRARGPS